MSITDWLLLAFSHTAAVAFGCAMSLLWLPPDTTSLLLGLVLGVMVVIVGLLALNLIKTAKGE